MRRIIGLVLLVAFFLLGPMVAVVALTGCNPAKYPEEYRAAIVLASEATQVADHTCAIIALEKKDANLATVCAVHYTAARNAFLTAESGLDATQEKNALCAFRDGLASLYHLADVATNAGAIMPPIVRDAFRFGEPIASLATGCKA